MKIEITRVVETKEKIVTRTISKTIREEVEIELPFYFKCKCEYGRTIYGRVREEKSVLLFHNSENNWSFKIETCIPDLMSGYMAGDNNSSEEEFLEAVKQFKKIQEEI